MVWRRAAPTLCIRDLHKEEKMAIIHEALEKCSVENPVFYEDEVDIQLNPEIRVIYQLVYSPWVNHVALSWQSLHDTIT